MRQGLRYLLLEVLDPAERDALMDVVIPFALRQLEDLPLIFPTASVSTLPSSTTAASATVHLTKQEVSILLSCSLFSMHAESRSRRYPTANFNDLFVSIAHIGTQQQRAVKRGDVTWDRTTAAGYNNIEKLRSLLFYFRVISQRSAEELTPIISFHRRSVGKVREDVWMDALSSDAPLPEFEVFPDSTIEDDLLPSPSIHLDFANKVPPPSHTTL